MKIDIKGKRKSNGGMMDDRWSSLKLTLTKKHRKYMQINSNRKLINCWTSELKKKIWWKGSDWEKYIKIKEMKDKATYTRLRNEAKIAVNENK